MSHSILTKRVKELVLKNHLHYVGVAPVERLRDEPEGKRPETFLPGARSVVVLGVRLSLGAQLSQALAHQRYRSVICSYLWHGFGLPNVHYLDRTAFLVARLIEKEGHIAVPLLAASPFDLRGSLTEFSNIHAAAAAGLGDVGWNGFLMTPDAGPRARFVSVITTAQLDADPPYKGATLCQPDKCRGTGEREPVCSSVCPVNALGNDSQTIRIGEKRFLLARFDRNRCLWASMGMSAGSLAVKPLPVPDNVGIGDVFQALKARDPRQTAELAVIGRGDYCGKCIMECPVGRPAIVDELVSRAKTFV